MADTGMVAISAPYGKWPMLPSAEATEHSDTAPQTRTSTSLNKDALGSFSLIRKALGRQRVPRTAQEIIIKSWRDSTKKQYHCYIQQWLVFCGRSKNPIKPSVNQILAFFVTLHNKGLKYSAFQTARAAINNFIQICGNENFSSHYLIQKFMKGVYNLKPSLPRYGSIWDVKIVLTFIEKMADLTLLELSAKLSMLFLLVTAQRSQMLHLIETKDIEFQDNFKVCVIRTNHILKQTRPGYHLQDIVLHSYNNEKLCVVETLREYLRHTEGLRTTETKLLISTTPRGHSGNSFPMGKILDAKGRNQ